MMDVKVDKEELLSFALTRLYYALSGANRDNGRRLYPGEDEADRAWFALDNLKLAMVEIMADLVDGDRDALYEQIEFYLDVYERRRQLWDDEKSRAYMRAALEKGREISFDEFVSHLAEVNEMERTSALRKIAAYWWRRSSMESINVAIRTRVRVAA